MKPGPCLSPNVVDRPSRPITKHPRLGKIEFTDYLIHRSLSLWDYFLVPPVILVAWQLQTYMKRNPVSKHQIQPKYGDEQADAERDCRTRLARPNSFSGANGDRELFIFPVQLTSSRIGNLTRLILTPATVCAMTIHNSCGQYGQHLTFEQLCYKFDAVAKL